MHFECNVFAAPRCGTQDNRNDMFLKVVRGVLIHCHMQTYTHYTVIICINTWSKWNDSRDFTAVAAATCCLVKHNTKSDQHHEYAAQNACACVREQAFIDYLKIFCCQADFFFSQYNWLYIVFYSFYVGKLADFPSRSQRTALNTPDANKRRPFQTGHVFYARKTSDYVRRSFCIVQIRK